MGLPHLPSNKSLTRLPHSGGRNSLIINDLRRGGEGANVTPWYPRTYVSRKKSSGHCSCFMRWLNRSTRIRLSLITMATVTRLRVQKVYRLLYSIPASWSLRSSADIVNSS